MADTSKEKKYTRDQLREAVRGILNKEISYRKAKEDYCIPISVLRYHVKLAKKKLPVDADGKYGNIDTVKDHAGREPSLCTGIETKIRVFIEDCSYMGIPRCKGKLALDIQDYLRRKQIHVENFEDDKPGRHYLEKYKLDAQKRKSEMKTAKQVKSIENSEVKIDEWVGNVHRYLVQVDESLITDKSMVFVMQAQIFLTYTEPTRELSIIVIYDGYGQVIEWIFVSDGNVLNDDISLSGRHEVMFLRTPMGGLNSTVIKNCMILIKRHITQDKKSGYALVLMDMFVAANFDLFVWEFCKANLILTLAIPRSICQSFRVFNIGPMCKYASEMLLIMQTRFISIEMEMNELHYLYNHAKVAAAVISKGNIGNLLKMLCISRFVGKKSHESNDVPVPDVVFDEPSSTCKVVNKKVKRRKILKKGKAQCNTTDMMEKVGEGTEMVQLIKPNISTQTDSDFEEFLQMTEEEFRLHQVIMQMQLYQQYLVNNIVEKDFENYDSEEE